jgi:glutamine amidotransferase
VSPPLIAVLDYGIGNLGSAQKALQLVAGPAAEVRLVASREAAEGASGVVLPGVGAFGRCMEELRRSGLDAVAKEALNEGTPFLGVCVGMQMLYDGSEESPDTAGLGIVPGRVRRLPAGVKRPQMQWNQLQLSTPEDPLFAGIEQGDWVYFVHSYAADAGPQVIATTDYGGPVTAAIGSVGSVGPGGLWATQFHPEKSGRVGLRMLANFVGIVTGSR